MIIRKNGYSWVGVEQSFFTEEECEEVIALCEDSFIITENMYGRGNTIKRFTKNFEETPFEERLIDLTNEFNERTYNFHLIDSFTTFVNKYERDLQLDWHKDENETLGKIYEKTPPNRVSVSIGLNTEYEGGEFELESWNGRTVRIDKGTAVIFCGSELHKAHPVQQGVRYSLGAWRKGIR
tara:strand:- start:29 stop:571 length:543 start_codon:yes stop_codon:yes gene_type:complete